MELLIYVVIFIVITNLPEILKKLKNKREYKYPDFDDVDSSAKTPGQIIIKKEDTLSTSGEIYFDLEDFFKTEYKQEVKIQEPASELTDTQKKYIECMNEVPKKEVVMESSGASHAVAVQNQLSRNDIVRGIVFSEIIMKPRAYRPFRGPNI